jgi:molybdenum cofactor synthesis domain-containing protein
VSAGPDEDAPEALVVTVSTRASAGVYEDRSGPVVVEALRALGFVVGDPVVVPDGDAVGETLRAAVAAGRALVVTTGGTGLSPDDHTPEQTREVVQRELPALVAEIARYGVEHGVPTAVLSRGVAGVADQTLIVNLPGSTGGARDGMAVLAPVLPHAVAQLRGADHRR